MYKLVIKVEKHSKNKRPFCGSYLRPSTQAKHFAHPKYEAAPRDDKSKDKGKGIVKEFPYKLDGKRYIKCQGYSRFHADCPNKRALTIREIQDINQIHLETSEEEEYQREHIFYSRCTLQGKVFSVIIDEGSYTNVVYVYWIYKLKLPTI